MITAKNESKILAKDLLCECKCRFDRKNVIQINGGIRISIYVSVKTSCMWKSFIWNPATFSCQNVKHLASIVDDSAITYDDNVDADGKIKSNDEKTKTFPANFNKKKI